MSIPVRRSAHWLLTLFIAAGFVAWIGGCEEDSTPESPTTSSPVEISRVEAVPALVAPGETTLVRARVLERADGRPAAGYQVNFGEIAGKDWGDFLKTAELTDAEGWAASGYIPTTIDSGQVGLRVQVGEEIAYLTVQVDPSIGTADPGGLQVVLTAAETALPADGESRLNLQVQVKQTGEPLAGQTVRFAAGELFQDLDHDGVWSAGDVLLVDQNDNGRWDAIGSVTDSVVTGGDGSAAASYTAGETIGPVYVKATAERASTDLEIRLHPTGTVVALTVEPSELPADGMALAQVRAEVTDPMGAPVPGKLVRFTAGEPFVDDDEDGYFTPGRDSYEDVNENGRWDASGQLASSATTDAGGVAHVVYEAGYEVGSYFIVASTRSARSDVEITQMSLPPVARGEMEGLDEAELYGNGVDTGSFTLQVWDAHDQSIAGQSVRLTAGERFTDADGDGVFTPDVDTITEEVIENGQWDALGTLPEQVATGSDGRASFDYTAPDVSGTVWIKATAGAWSADFALEILPLPSVGYLEVGTAYGQISLRNSGGRDRTSVGAALYDISGTRMPAGVPVVFSITSGPGTLDDGAGGETSEVSLETDAGGEATALVLAGETMGVIQLAISSGTASQTLQIAVEVGPPASITLTPELSELDSWTSTPVHAAVVDAYNNPVAD
ncbi:MAG: hypothetical protein GF355_14285, partial [Candidatus Eisenbacteria bacterium]|nr:hypothetical protein [Candidatus Eisenbacteria bacterium]